jgi:hypothetical protein
LANWRIAPLGFLNRQGAKSAKKSPAPIFKDVSINVIFMDLDELSECKGCESPNTLKNGCRVKQQGKRLRHYNLVMTLC